MNVDENKLKSKSVAERSALAIALLLNVGLAVGLGVAGAIADSSGLIASALDNLSDATVYALSYYAVGRGARWKSAPRSSPVRCSSCSRGWFSQMLPGELSRLLSRLPWS